MPITCTCASSPKRTSARTNLSAIKGVIFRALEKVCLRRWILTCGHFTAIVIHYSPYSTNWIKSPIMNNPRFWRDSRLPFIEARSIENSQKLAYDEHSHDTFSIGAITRGTNFYQNSSVQYKVNAGSVVIINPHDVHACKSVASAPWSYLMLFVDTAWMMRLQNDCGIQFTRAPNFNRSTHIWVQILCYFRRWWIFTRSWWMMGRIFCVKKSHPWSFLFCWITYCTNTQARASHRTISLIRDSKMQRTSSPHTAPSLCVCPIFARRHI